jgi:opacity protein-like surface antigen
MPRNIVGAILVLALLGGVVRAAAAQETGTPIFKAPYRAFEHHELGASFSDPGSGVSFALEGFYRYGSGPYDLSLRGGFEDLSNRVNGVDVGGGTRVLLGGDFRTQVISYSESFPMDGALTVGFGMNVGDGPDSYYVPVGVSLGRRFTLEGSNTTFLPFAHPVLVPVFGGGDSNVDFALGLGVDVRFSESLALRASGGIGDIDGVGISVAYIR